LWENPSCTTIVRIEVDFLTHLADAVVTMMPFVYSHAFFAEEHSHAVATEVDDHP
jgi:hypothetical protein